MPKERRAYSSSGDQDMVCTYCFSTKSLDPNNCGIPFSDSGDEKEWEEARCPICMEHPHNAVLLRCSSREKGCRPFICDTSYRHSYCLDQFQRSASTSLASLTEQQTKLICPLCRGVVTGWDVVQPARKFMNSKTRTCALETCDFSGNYDELRKHARREHPSERPSEATPTRQSNWERMEREQDIEDAFAHQSDIEYNYDGWPSLYEMVINLFDEDFFDFSSEITDLGVSDIEDVLEDVMYIDQFSVVSFNSFAPEDMTDSGSSRQRHTQLRSIESTNLGSRSNNQVRFTTASSRSRSDYPGNNGRNTSRLRSSYPRENAPESLRTRSTYPRENRSPISTSRSSYYRQRASGRSRTNSSNRRELFQPRSRTRPR